MHAPPPFFITVILCKKNKSVGSDLRRDEKKKREVEVEVSYLSLSSSLDFSSLALRERRRIQKRGLTSHSSRSLFCSNSAPEKERIQVRARAGEEEGAPRSLLTLTSEQGTRENPVGVPCMFLSSPVSLVRSNNLPFLPRFFLSPFRVSRLASLRNEACSRLSPFQCRN